MSLYPKIVVIKRNGTDGPQFPLRTNECLFGRKPECDIRIQLPNVSLEHALVEVDNDRKIKLINLSSCNQTLLNGKAISEAEIQHLDVLTISDRSFRFELPLPLQKQGKSPKNHYHLSNTPQEKKTPKMPTSRGSPRTPPAVGSLKENIHILRRHSMPFREEDEEFVLHVTEKTPLSLVDVNKEQSDGDTHVQPVGVQKAIKEEKCQRRSKRVSFGPVLSPEQFDKDLPPSTPLRRGATPRRASLSDDHSLVPLALSAKRRRSVAASLQSESIQGECGDEGPLDDESPNTWPQQRQISEYVSTPNSNQDLSKNLSEVVDSHQHLDHLQEYATPKDPEPTEDKEGTSTVRRRSSLRLAAKSANLSGLCSPKAQSATESPGFCMEEKMGEAVLDSDDYTSDEEDEFEKTDDDTEQIIDDELNAVKNKIPTPLKKEITRGLQLRQTKKKLATPLRTEIKRGLQLRQTRKKLATPLRKEITGGFQLRQTKRKIATPLLRDITSGVQLRQTKKKIATPLKKEIMSGVKLRQTKKKMATPLRKEILTGVQLRQTKTKMPTPLRKEITNGVELRQTKKKMPTPLRKQILTGVQLRQIKNKMPTPLRKEITSRIKLRQTKKKMATPLRKQILTGVQLRQTKKKMATPLRKEILTGVQLRQTKNKMPTPVRKEIINGVKLRQTKKKMASPLRNEIACGVSLRQTKKKMAMSLQEEIIKGVEPRRTRNKLPTPIRNEIASKPNLRETKKTMNSLLQAEIKRGSKLKKTKQGKLLELQTDNIKGETSKKSLPTPVRKQVEEGIVLNYVNTSSKRKRSEDGSQRKKLKLSSDNGSVVTDEGQTSAQIRRALKTPLRKAIVAGIKLRPTRQRMATPLRKQIHSKPTLRAFRRKSAVGTILTKSAPRKPTYAEIVKRRPKKTDAHNEISKIDPTPRTTTSDVLTKPEASKDPASKGQWKEKRDSTSFRKMSSLALAAKGVKILSDPMKDLEGLADMFATAPSLVNAEKASKKQIKGNWLSSLAKMTNGPRRCVGSPVEDLVGISEMFVTPPSVRRLTRLTIQNASASPEEHELRLIAAVKPTSTPSLRRCGGDSQEVKEATPVQNSYKCFQSVNTDGSSPQAMLEVTEPLKLSKTPSLRHSAEEVVSLEGVTTVQLSRTPSLRSTKKEPSVLAHEASQLQLDLVPPIEIMKTPSLRPADEVQTVFQKDGDNSRNDRESLCLEGLRHLMKPPKQNNAVENSEDFFVASMFASPKLQPKRYSRKSEGLQGVARLLRTPDARSETAQESPKLHGLKALMQETEDFPSPSFVGLKKLMKTPKTSETVNHEDNFNSDLFATAEADIATNPAGRHRRNSKRSEPVEAQEKLAKDIDNVKGIARTTRAKRIAPKGLTEPEPKRIRRTRVSINQRDESGPENYLKAAEKKGSTGSKKNTAVNKQTTPKRSVYKRTQLDPIIEVPSPVQSLDSPHQLITLSHVTQIEEQEVLQERRQTRSAASKQPETIATSLPSGRRGKRIRREVDSSPSKEEVIENPLAKRGKRDGGRKVGSEATREIKVQVGSKENEKEDTAVSSPKIARVTRSRKALLQEEKHVYIESTNRATKRPKLGSKTVKENVSVLKSKRIRREVDSSPSKEEVIENPLAKRGKRDGGRKVGSEATRKSKVQVGSKEDEKGDRAVSSPEIARVTRSRKAEVLLQEEKHVYIESTNRATKRPKRGSKTVKENVSVLTSTKTTPSENSEDSSSTRRTRKNQFEIAVQETSKPQQESLLKKPRLRSNSKGKASNDPTPSTVSEDMKENSRGPRSTSARIQTRSSTRK